MSKVIKPLLNADGTQVRRPIKVGEYYYSILSCDYMQWKADTDTNPTFLIYYAEDWKPKQEELYYYQNIYDKSVLSVYNHSSYPYNQINLIIGNCFRTREEAEQADIQVILDNLKTYYKNKEGK